MENTSKIDNDMLLKGFRGRECLTQKQLSKLTGISIKHISMLENRKKPFTKDIIDLLAKALNTETRFFERDDIQLLYFDEKTKQTIFETKCQRCFGDFRFTFETFIFSDEFIRNLKLTCPFCKEIIRSKL